MTKKVKELAIHLYEETRRQFPEINFHYIQPHPEMRKRYWIMVTGTMTEKRQRAMRKFVADRATDILIDEGYSFAVMIDHSLETARQANAVMLERMMQTDDTHK
jgi:hypothetical protein